MDIIETEAIANPTLSEECLLAELDKFSDAELKTIAQNLDKSDSADRSAGEEALADFKAALESCTASS
jgi:hypothetical protein